MAPSNQPNPTISEGRSGEYRRRSHANPSSAIAAAEAAASYILSDGPIAKKKTIRNRSSNAGGSASGSAGGSNDVNSGNANINNSGNFVHVGGSFLLRMHMQRERLMQRQRRERAFSSWVAVWVVLFVVGILFLFDGGKQHQQDQRNLDHYFARGKSKKEGRISANDVTISIQSPLLREKEINVGIGAKVSVPLPPNVERKHLNDRQKIHADVPTNHSKELNAVPRAASKVDNAEPPAREMSGGRHHAIPPVLIFTYHTNLLTTPELELTGEEDVALSKNVQGIISLHSGSSVRFLNDDDCLESIRNALGPDTNLTFYFKNEEHGMYKADICRGAALYETGGMYFDVDIEARMSLWDAIAPKTEFVTTLVHKDSNHHGGFFQAFIGVTPQHPIMKQYLELFVRYYEGKLKVDGPLGVYFLRMAYDAIIGEDGDDAKIELWQEVRYHPKLFPDVTRKWGARRVCQMLVMAPPRKSKGFKRERMVPFFSHSNGSRMCGGKDTIKGG